MSVWKSPVFYFGVFLVLAVACLLAAPYSVNWNAWKPEMEAYGRKLTGREVAIGGPVEVRLFPWPRLEARDVRLANEQGFGEAPLLVANTVTLRFSLAGLFNGALEVEEIALDAPDLNLVRDETGAMNWRLRPAASLSGLLSRVKLDHISLRKGSIWFDDRLHNQSANLTEIDATLSADAIEGPWRMQGNARWRDAPVDLSLALAMVEEGKPLRLATTVKPQDAALPVFVMDGEWQPGHFDGKLRIMPQEGGKGKTSIDAAFKPLSLQSDLKWSRDSMQFDNIRIAPADVTDKATLIEGSATVALSQTPKAQVALKSSRVNLDTILGAEAQARWRRGGMLDLANGVLAGLPEKLVAEFALDVTVLTLGGETLNDVVLRGMAEKQAIRIHKAEADLPGRSRVLFDGVIFPAAGSAELGGALSFESFDLRSFTAWVEPGWKQSLANVWTGARGRLKLQSNVNWSLARLAFRDAGFELDGEPGTAQMTWRYGEVPVLDLQFTARNLDIDAYAARPSTGSAAGVFDALAALPAILDIGQIAEQRVMLRAKSVRLNGQTAGNVAIEYDAGLSGLQVKAFDADIAGGTIRGEGLVTKGQDGALGEFDVSMKTDDPRAFLRLTGILPDSAPALWEGLLGPTDARLTLQVEPQQGQPSIRYGLQGRSADVAFKAEGQATAQTAAGAPRLESAFTVTVPDAGRLLDLYLPSQAQALGALTLSGTLSGAQDAEMRVEAKAEMKAASLTFTGKLTPGAPFQGVAGTAALQAPSLAGLATLVSAPVAIENDGPVAWTAAMSVAEGSLRIQQDSGSAAGGAFEVKATIDPTGRIAADVETGPLRLGSLLSAALLPWTGAAPDLLDAFASPDAKGLHGEIFIRPRALITGFGPAETKAVIAIDASEGSLALNIKTPGRGLSFDGLMEPKGGSFAFTGQGEAAVDVPALLSKTDGKPLAQGRARLQGQFTASGQSPAAAIASLEGKGVYWVEEFTLPAVTAGGFAERLASASKQEDLTRLFADVTSAPGTRVGARTGEVKLAGGLLSFAPFGINDGNAALVITPSADLNVPDIRLSADVSTRLRPELPPLTVTYEGAPGALEERVANAALAAKLGYELLAQELAALEKLQREQAEILRKQEQQRREDEERFAAFQAQRAELRAQMRLLRFNQQERRRAAEERDAAVDAAIATGAALNRQDLQRAQRLQAFRRQPPLLQP